MPGIFFAKEITDLNPFSSDRKYNEDWVELSITNSREYEMMTTKSLLFSFKISRFCNGWHFCAMDYIEYNIMFGRNVIFTGDMKDFEEAKTLYQGHSIYDPFLRPHEPDVLVHSTTLDGYRQIIKDGALKSWNKVKTEHGNSDDKPIGALLGDPHDFSDYVMLGGGLWIEIVVNSKQKGNVCMDADCEYIPGARFYFDTKQLIKDGLLIRDGGHYKVKDELPISYSLFCATLENVYLSGKVTPKSFSMAADKAFGEIKGITNPF